MATIRDSSTQNTTPADPVTMALFHSALERDLSRARVLLKQPDLTVRRQRRLGRHLLWLMAQLRWHHEGEDHSLWPLLLERAPEARAVLEDMEQEHHALDGPLLLLEAAARGLVARRADRHDVVAALDSLTGPLLDHLGHEESAALPVVRRALSHAEWQAFEQEAWIDGFTVPETLRFLRWICDGVRHPDLLARGLRAPSVVQKAILGPLTRSTAVPGMTVWAGTPAARVGNPIEAGTRP